MERVFQTSQTSRIFNCWFINQTNIPQTPFGVVRLIEALQLPKLAHFCFQLTPLSNLQGGGKITRSTWCILLLFKINRGMNAFLPVETECKECKILR